MKFSEFLNEASTIVNWTRTNRKEITKTEFDKLKSKIENDADKAGHDIGSNSWYDDKNKVNGTQYFSKHSDVKSIERQFHKDSDQNKYYQFT